MGVIKFKQDHEDGVPIMRLVPLEGAEETKALILCHMSIE